MNAQESVPFSAANRFDRKGKNAEKFVHELSLKTFLVDWCYPNPKLPDGKELCDLLVVFDEVAIIWQIKDLKLGPSGKYRKREVELNLRQIEGDRRQLLDLKTPIELENPHRGKERFDAAKIREVYLISALLGESEDWGSLLEYTKARAVHVFTRDFTQIVLTELDTISDFTAYLRAKELLPQSMEKHVISGGGEEELLSMYLSNDRGFSAFNGGTVVCLETGMWEEFAASDPYRAKKKRDRISYVWDKMIDRMHECSGGYETVARELARPNRFWRRCLSETFLDACDQATHDRYPLFRRTADADGVTYCFLFADERAISGEVRRSILTDFVHLARAAVEKNHKVIGIATEKGVIPQSYDFGFLDLPTITEDFTSQVEAIKNQTGIWTRLGITTMTEREYPPTP